MVPGAKNIDLLVLGRDLVTLPRDRTISLLQDRRARWQGPGHP